MSLCFKRYGLQLLALFLLLILAACGGGGGGGGGSAPIPGGISLSRIEVTPSLPVLASGTTLSLTATGIFSDNSSLALNNEVTWSSSDNSIATLSPGGEVSTLAAGQVTVQATFGNVSGSAELTVSSAVLTQLEISPGSVLLAKGSSLNIVLIGTYSDGSTQNLETAASWNVVDTTVASISDPTTGPLKLAGVAVGTTQLTASVGGVNVQINITVSAAELIQIVISPETPTLPLGTALNLSAVGQYGDGSSQDLSNQVNWSSGDTGIFTVDAAGLLTPKSLGSITVTASFAGVTSSQVVTVSSAQLTSIEINAATSMQPLGEQQAFTALGHYSDNSLQDITEQVVWLSNPVDRLAISNASGSRGLATALTVGAVTASATLGGVTGQFAFATNAATLNSIEISPPDARLAAGTFADFQATGRYSDGSIQDLSERVSWAALDAAIAAVSNASGDQGQAQALTVGSTTVTATLDGVAGNASLAVTAAQLLSISVLPSELSLAAGGQQTLSAEGNFSDGSVQVLDDQVSWESDKPAIVAVFDGAVSALQSGSARVSASLAGVSGNSSITVTSATLTGLQITPASPALAVGTSTQLQVNALYSDGSQEDVTARVIWSGANDSLLRVENGSGQQGRITALGSGSVVVTTSLNGVSDSVTTSIGAASLTGLRIVTGSTSLDSVEQLQLVAMGDFSDGSSQDLTAETVWRSDVPARAFVSNDSAQQGQVEAGVGVSGSVVITASYGGFNPTLNLTVNDTPQRPVSLVILATPNVILNDGVDSSTLEIRVRAADPAAAVADGTVINLRVSQAGSVLSNQNLVTTGGVANVVLTSTQTGLLQLQATVAGTSVNNSAVLYTSASMAIFDVIATAGLVDAITDGTTVFSGGRFGFFLYNLSNRDFPLTRFELRNGSDILFSTITASELAGGMLSGSLKMGIVVTLNADVPDQGIEARYYLTSPATGETFFYRVVFTTP